MQWTHLFHCLGGYVHIRAEGIFLERFLNICMRRDLDIRNVRRCGAERLTADMSKDSFLKIRPVCRRTKTRITILAKKGLPFFLHRYRRRHAALIGLFAALALLWYCSGHIMGIKVFGNSRIPTEEILTHLASSGVSLGRSARHIDSSQIRNRLMRDIDDLAWVGINVSGSRIYVEIVERLEKEKGIPMDQPCNLTAAKDGEIELVTARNGQTMVKPGSGVCAGDVLVSGVMDNAATGIRTVHAYGEVFAKTRYTAKKEYPLKYEEAIDTGAKRTRYTLKILNRVLPLYFKNTPPYETYRLDESETEYRLPIESSPSLWIKKQCYADQKIVSKSRTAAEAVAAAREALSKELRESIADNAEIIDEESESSLTERGTVMVTLTLICRENIAVETPIDGIDGMTAPDKANAGTNTAE